MGEGFEGDAVEELHLFVGDFLADERCPVHGGGDEDDGDEEIEGPGGVAHDELGGGEHGGEESEDGEGGVDEHEGGPDGGVGGEAALDVGVWIREVVFACFDVEPGGPEMAVFDGDDEHEVVACRAAFDGVVVVVHDANEEL